MLKVGQVTSVGAPFPKYKTITPNVGVGIQPEMVVDIHAKTDEQEYDFKQLPCNSSVSNYGNAIVSDSREAMLSEVDDMKQRSQGILDSVEYHEKVLVACDEMLKSLNPNFAKEVARDEAINSLSERLDNFEKKFGQSLSNIEKLLSKGGK